MAQLVEHHLAKVRVAGSNPVVRSERISPSPNGEKCFLVEWPRGEATDCKSVYTGSNPVSTSRQTAWSGALPHAAADRPPPPLANDLLLTRPTPPVRFRFMLDHRVPVAA